MREFLSSGTQIEVVENAESKTGLVLIPDIWGMRSLFDELAARLAQEWNVSVAVVEPFPEAPGETIEERFAAVPKLDDTRLLDDLDVAAKRLGKSRNVLMGFCMGGMYCFKASSRDTFAKIASFYGIIVLPENWQGPGQREPIQHMAVGHPERVLAIIGGKDHWTPRLDVEKLIDLRAKVALYPEADHGFVHDPARPSYRPADATNALAKARDWLLS